MTESSPPRCAPRLHPSTCSSSTTSWSATATASRSTNAGCSERPGPRRSLSGPPRRRAASADVATPALPGSFGARFATLRLLSPELGPRTPIPRLLCRFIALLVALGTAVPVSAEIWRGLVVAPEHRCAPYDKDHYPYSQSVELDIIESLGGRIYDPYTGAYFTSGKQTDIEHMVATSEAHDSGLCAAHAPIRARFASDLDNLTLSSPRVNRHQKSGKDAAEWLPSFNRCWFASRVVAVKRKYALTVDAHEAAALDAVLTHCASTKLVFSPPGTASRTAVAATAGDSDPLALWDDNGNGRITCKEARRHAIAPVKTGHPAYPFMRDGDGDGMVCE